MPTIRQLVDVRDAISIFIKIEVVGLNITISLEIGCFACKIELSHWLRPLVRGASLKNPTLAAAERIQQHNASYISQVISTSKNAYARNGVTISGTACASGLINLRNFEGT